jgi:hypothetical protein
MSPSTAPLKSGRADPFPPLPGTSKIEMGFGGSTATFAGGGFTYGDLSVNPSSTRLDRSTSNSSAGNVTITGTNTFNNVSENTGSAAYTVTYPVSVTTSMTGLSATGASGKLITMNSSSSGTAATLSVGALNGSLDYLSIKDLTASGAASPIHAGANSTLVSGDTNWLVP